jgi:hypothetical protein
MSGMPGDSWMVCHAGTLAPVVGPLFMMAEYDLACPNNLLGTAE